MWLAFLSGVELMILIGWTELETELLAHMGFSIGRGSGSGLVPHCGLLSIAELVELMGFGTHCGTCFLVGQPHTTASLS